MAKKGIYLNDSIHGLISLSEYEKRIISSTGFNRLHDVYQNSTVYLTFPANRTKRFEHSIGTMKLCSDMFFASILNAEENDLNIFFGKFKDIYIQIINEIGAEKGFCEYYLGGRTPKESNFPPKISMDKFKSSLIPYNVKKEYKEIYLILMQSVRAAALLHDIGHPPFSHIVEKALNEAYASKKYTDNSRSQEFLKRISPYFESKGQLHEKMGNDISSSILKNIISPIKKSDAAGFNENLFEVLVLKSVEHIFNEKNSFEYIHKIIDGSLDGDRLDYVTRDSVNSGISSGRIEYNRIINEMKLLVKDDKFIFCVPLKAVNSVEDFLKRRFNIYKDIIFHHRVIKTDSLLQYSVKDLVIEFLNNNISNDTKEGSDSSNDYLIPFDISGLWFPLGPSTITEKTNALSQWNDSWLMTVLKQIFYNSYYENNVEDEKQFILSQRLRELLQNEKNYYSLIKRNEHFKIVDDSIKKYIDSKRDDINSLVEILRNKSQQLIKEKAPDNKIVNIDPTLDFINELLNNTNNIAKGFIFSYIYSHSKAINIDSIENVIQEIVCEKAKKFFQNAKYYDSIVVFKRIDVGLKNTVYFYDNVNQIVELKKISGISKVLSLEADFRPMFYVYLLIEDGDEIIQNQKNQFLTSIGEDIGKYLIDKIAKELKSLSDQQRS